MELHDQLGGRTMLRFTEMKANAAVSPEAFTFKAPAGADVLEESAPRK
jgi:outer membrane lipoprotein-sorting protein